jgi:hypothetical protein
LCAGFRRRHNYSDHGRKHAPMHTNLPLRTCKAAKLLQGGCR